MVHPESNLENQEEAFRETVRHRTMLKGFIQAIVRDPILAEDVLSDAVIQIVRAWESYDRTRPFAPWARGIARRTALASLRKRKASPAQLDTEVLEAIGTQIDALNEKQRLESRKRTLRQCLKKLGAAQRNLIRLRFFENQTYEQISLATKKKTNALYVTYHRLQEMLLQCVQKNLESV